MKYDLSILIPARNEMFLKKTIENILENIKGNTEIIAVLDGYWDEIPQHERLTIIHNQESVGQRAATNQAARISTAKYLMKVDAHCAFDKGFDVKMMDEMHDDWTMIPTMYNLHAFDWVCKCGYRIYQGPTPDACMQCGEKMEREVIWKEKRNPTSNFFRFDNTLHFQYWKEFEKRPEAQGDICETMSIQGSCFMLTREKYWELNISDEAHGSWGQQGVEVACKTWLSGGRLVVNKKTWYAHMFRTQGGDFGFPYPNNNIEKARNYSRDLWINNKWDKAIHPLSWLIEKFGPVPGWDVSKGVAYYTCNTHPEYIMKRCQESIKKGVGDNRIVSVSLKPIDFGDNIALNMERGYLTMFKQILKALEILDTDIVFLCESDVLYHPSHFKFTPPSSDKYYYNMNCWQLRDDDGHAVYYDRKQTSGLCANRELLVKHYRERIRRVELEGFSRKMGFEPGTHNRAERVDDIKAEGWRSEKPNIDIRHGSNLTASRWKQSEFRDQRNCQNWKESDVIEGWGKYIPKTGTFEKV